LSNVFLHHVIDQWFTEQVRPRLQGPSTLVRFCDDFVMCFTHKSDADRVLAVLAKRLGKFGLQLHPEKTRLVDFRPWRSTREKGATLPTTFNFLGFTHVWGKSRKGNAVVRQLTSRLSSPLAPVARDAAETCSAGCEREADRACIGAATSQRYGYRMRRTRRCGIWCVHGLRPTARQLLSIPPIGLYPIPGLDRYQRRSHHLTLHPKLRQLPVKYVPRGARLVARLQLLGAAEFLHQPSNRLRPIRDRPKASDLATRFG
jgi:Reverse transcriptase (RNA-dependent DNA polymerase)